MTGTIAANDLPCVFCRLRCTGTDRHTLPPRNKAIANGPAHENRDLTRKRFFDRGCHLVAAIEVGKLKPYSVFKREFAA